MSFSYSDFQHHNLYTYIPYIYSPFSAFMYSINILKRQHMYIHTVGYIYIYIYRYKYLYIYIKRTKLLSVCKRFKRTKLMARTGPSMYVYVNNGRFPFSSMSERQQLTSIPRFACNRRWWSCPSTPGSPG